MYQLNVSGYTITNTRLKHILKPYILTYIKTYIKTI